MSELSRFHLIDIRESHEVARKPLSLPCSLLPFSEIDLDLYQPESNEPTLFVCRTGRRTGLVVEQLREKGCTNVYSLAGGVEALQYRLIQALEQV